MVEMYALLFRTGSLEALPKFVTILNKIIHRQDLSTRLQKFGMTRNLVIREALLVFEQNIWERVTETNANYELVIKYLVSQFFSTKVFQRQNRYLIRGLYKSHDTKIRYLICRIDKMIK